jgi:ABC-type multidrug transport system ATPase subunit
MIRVEQLGKRYGAFTALEGVSFEVSKAEIFGLVGPNGAGKTTILKSLLGIVIPTSGKCHVLDSWVQARPLEARRSVGYLPAEGRFYETMTGGAFLRFALGGYAEIDRALEEELVKAFALPLRKRIRGYSHGMKRKLGILQALVPRVPLAILDEPEEGLDPTARAFFLDLLVRLRAAGKTILLSSHQLESVAKVCDRVAFIAAGKLVDCDSVANIRERAGKRIRVRLRPGVDPAALSVPGVSEVRGRDGSYTVVAEGDPLEVLRRLAALPLDGLEFRQLRLEEIYADLYQLERSQ